jgi:uncharacterized membrane protein YebE (DUF533 family)
MKKKKLVKKALKNPHLFSQAELAYFDRWIWYRKQRKKAAKIEESTKANS